ncbi:hypothetical protein B0H14DRAFT_2556550 [Mycena olivaceomarginata]|nr:hypothetical protein B0H14DRAFT_2556550 [Mycena olivaceomarginata]
MNIKPLELRVLLLIAAVAILATERGLAECTCQRRRNLQKLESYRHQSQGKTAVREGTGRHQQTTNLTKGPTSKCFLVVPLVCSTITALSVPIVRPRYCGKCLPTMSEYHNPGRLGAFNRLNQSRVVKSLPKKLTAGGSWKGVFPWIDKYYLKEDIGEFAVKYCAADEEHKRTPIQKRQDQTRIISDVRAFYIPRGNDTATDARQTQHFQPFFDYFQPTDPNSTILIQSEAQLSVANFNLYTVTTLFRLFLSILV